MDFRSLETSQREVVEWKSPIGPLKFSRCTLKTDYEKKEMKFLNQFISSKIRQMWILRPKVEGEEDKENIVTDSNVKKEFLDYHDSRGAPAPVPWANETRVKIQIKELPPAISTESEFISICNELIRNREMLKNVPAIVIPSRNQKQFPEKVGLIRFEDAENGGWIDVIDAYKYRKESDGLEIHIPSEISLEEVLREANLMQNGNMPLHTGEVELAFRMVYNPILPVAREFSISFNWTNENGEILGAPSLEDESISSKMRITLDPKPKSIPESIQIVQSDLDQLSKITKSIQLDQELTGTKLDLKSTKTVLNAGSGDVISDIWNACKAGGGSDICAWMNAFIQSVKNEQSDISVPYGDDTDIGRRILKAQNNRGMVRKISKDSAIEMMVECGERNIRQLIEKVHSSSRHAQLNGLIKTHWSKMESMEDHLELLCLLFKLHCLGHALDTIKAPQALFTEACTQWIKMRRNDENPTIELRINPNFGWGLSRTYHPSEWRVSVENYQLVLRDSAPTDRQGASKLLSTPVPSYFVFEKTSRKI